METTTIEVLSKKKGDATKEFQSKRKGLLVLCSSQYLSFSWHEKFAGNLVDGVWPVTEGVNARDSVSGKDKVVSGDISTGWFERLG